MAHVAFPHNVVCILMQYLLVFPRLAAIEGTAGHTLQRNYEKSDRNLHHPFLKQLRGRIMLNYRAQIEQCCSSSYPLGKFLQARLNLLCSLLLLDRGVILYVLNVSSSFFQLLLHCCSVEIAICVIKPCLKHVMVVIKWTIYVQFVQECLQVRRIAYRWIGIYFWVHMYKLRVQGNIISFSYGSCLSRVQSNGEIIISNSNHDGGTG